MVCEKCEKKLSKVIVPDKWKEGASNTTEGGGRKINENKLLSKKKRWSPYGNTKCMICKQQVHQDGKYCHTCAYSKGTVEFVLCAESKYLTPSFINKAMHNTTEMLSGTSGLSVITDILVIVKLMNM
ncbi:hypothetical protein POTOM_016672 [Populus tomentosa]|uniref:Cysteine-rich PDZ-binding protein n=1 Tax=Populus tomentosa TaxID=118781 RepID=A0A8X7ZW94_POPTO|nr:hypothetical protein POTOM_016672 [Populus tomentosa]